MCVCMSVSMLAYVHMCVRTSEGQRRVLPGAGVRGTCESFI